MTEFHGVCVIKKNWGDVVGLACTTRKAKKMPKTSTRRIGDTSDEVFWFDNVIDAQAFYNNTAKTIKRSVDK